MTIIHLALALFIPALVLTAFVVVFPVFCLIEAMKGANEK